MSVSIGAQYTKDTRHFNGLDGIEKELIEEALNGHPTRRYAVVAFEVSSVVIDANKGTRQPRVNVSNIEVMHGEEAADVKAKLDKEFRYRTGRMDAPGDTLFEDPDAVREPAAIEAAPATVDGDGTVDGEGPGTVWPVVDGEAAADGTSDKPAKRGRGAAKPAESA